jgi:hypothetical protein
MTNVWVVGLAAPKRSPRSSGLQELSRREGSGEWRRGQNTLGKKGTADRIRSKRSPRGRVPDDGGRVEGELVGGRLSGVRLPRDGDRPVTIRTVRHPTAQRPRSPQIQSAVRAGEGDEGMVVGHGTAGRESRLVPPHLASGVPMASQTPDATARRLNRVTLPFVAPVTGGRAGRGFGRSACGQGGIRPERIAMTRMGRRQDEHGWGGVADIGGSWESPTVVHEF